MASERDTDRLAGDLLQALMGTMNKPVPSTRSVRQRPQVDERSMLSTIKDFLNQSIPGMKERDEQSSSAASHFGAGGAPTPAAVGGRPPVQWQDMYRRQEKEREAMYGRQSRELDEMRARHVVEMETLAGIRRTPVREETRPYVRPKPQAAVKPDTSSKAWGIVPGKSIGRWSVETENGSKTFMAVNQEQALREASRRGLTPTSATLTSVHTYEPGELDEMLGSFGREGRRAGARDEFERAIKLGLIPEKSEFERLDSGEWGYRVGTSKVVRKGSDVIAKLGRR